MSLIDDIRNTLNEIQATLATVNDRCQHATGQAQQAKATADQLGSHGLAAKTEELQNALSALEHQIAQSQVGAALAAHNANEIAASTS
ncbi:MAG: hypothetical protein ACRDT8_22835 [Micromonosporaceae bacterium]